MAVSILTVLDGIDLSNPASWHTTYLNSLEWHMYKAHQRELAQAYLAQLIADVEDRFFGPPA